MTMVPVFLGMAAVLVFIGIIIWGDYCLRQRGIKPHGAAWSMFFGGASALFALLYLLYFLVSWVPFEFGQCVGMTSCMAEMSMKTLLDVRWQSAGAFVGLAIIAICCLWISVKIVNRDEALA
jgi:hypothetical protein